MIMTKFRARSNVSPWVENENEHIPACFVCPVGFVGILSTLFVHLPRHPHSTADSSLSSLGDPADSFNPVLTRFDGLARRLAMIEASTMRLEFFCRVPEIDLVEDGKLNTTISM